MYTSKASLKKFLCEIHKSFVYDNSQGDGVKFTQELCDCQKKI
jgi:hypothetical protein